MIKIWIKKLINIAIIQVTFIYTLNISAIKNIKISITTTTKITDKNAGMQKCVKQANNKYKVNECKTRQKFSKFL